MSPANKETTKEREARTLRRLNSLRNQFTRTANDKLAGKVCVITGAGSKKGIGHAAAFSFAQEGAAHLYLLDFMGDSLPGLERALIEAYPGTKECDAADSRTISDICERAIAEEGRLDVFFANAGIGGAYAIPDITKEIFIETMRVNVLSCFLAVKHASKAMSITSKDKQEGGGSIIMTASVAAIRSGATVDYSTSKAAVSSIAKTAACELAGTNIRVNALCPGIIETAMSADIFDFAKARGSLGKLGHLNPLQRYGIPEEVAQLAVFLASDDSSYINAQNIAIDGGLSGSHPVAPGRSW
ncbi:hypothetical protein FRB94_004049 [Tulasnella sp. JGI-2019a]|nr:hypothetical protein FRB94_004049 [Tulasnella sp. JGI-2019a]KAG9038670.1 hypothetical protein FRB95_000260 [Tulasnella sp. JGI-2019a]